MIRVECPSCSKRIKIPAELLGKKVSCKCGVVLRLPEGASPSPEDLEKDILFSCADCKTKLRVAIDAAGKTAKCKCGELLQVPIPVTALPPKEVPVEVPLASAFEDLMPILSDPVEQFSPTQPASTSNEPTDWHTANNPYAPPAKTNDAWKTDKRPRIQSSSKSDVQQVIKGQKWLIYAVLSNIVCFLAPILSGVAGPLIAMTSEQAAGVVFVVSIGVFVVAYVASIILGVIGLAMIGRIVVGGWWMLAIPMILMPCFWVTVLLIINMETTRYLQAKGIKAGLLGAKK